MRILSGIGSLMLLGAAIVALIAWLSGRSRPIPLLLGRLIAAAVAAFCLITVTALIADNGLGPQLRLGGLLAVLTFVLIGTAAITSAWRARRPQRRAA